MHVITHRKLFKSRNATNGMEANTTNVRIEDLNQLKNDIELIKNILLSEGELTEWAKRELAEARQVPESECISHEDAKQIILQK